jgi:hypothetical protein
MGMPMSGGEIEDYEQDDEESAHDYSKNHEDSKTNLNNQDIAGITTKPRPKTAKAKNDDDNIFYRR